MAASVPGRSSSQAWADCCLSRSASATHSPEAAKYPARLVASVLLPTPPFGFATTITVMNSPGKKAGRASRFAVRYRQSDSGVVDVLAALSLRLPLARKGRGFL